MHKAWSVRSYMRTYIHALDFISVGHWWYVHAYPHAQPCMYVHTPAILRLAHANMHVHFYACVHVHMYVHMYTHSCMYTHVHRLSFETPGIHTHNYTQPVYINSIWLLTVQTIPQLICHIYTWRQTPYRKQHTPQDGTDPHSNVDYLQHINIPVVLSKWSWKRIIKYRYKHTFKTLKP